MSKNLDLTTSIIIIYSSSSLTSVFSIFLSLLPPSCMVVPIRELGNIILSTVTTCSTTNNMASVKIAESGLSFSLFSLLFLFYLFIYFSLFLFLEL